MWKQAMVCLIALVALVKLVMAMPGESVDSRIVEAVLAFFR